MALEPAKLSDFRMGPSLGSGTTARVYEAVHVASGRPVAIKMLAGEQSGGREARERVAREALLLAGVQSRHVCTILGFGFDRGRPFLVLERLEGETLDAKLRRDGAPPMPVAFRWVEQLLVGLRDCHAAKIIHRDVKPSNMFLHREGGEEIVKIINLGVGRIRVEAESTGALTSKDHVLGSMGYMAPEQFRDASHVDFAADLYAVGVVVFRILTGRLPFVTRSLEAVLRMKTREEPPAISSMPGMPSSAILDGFVKKAMAADPRARFQSAREMLERWWTVIASFDEEATTDVMRGIGRVDESYAGPLHRGAGSSAPAEAPDSAPVSSATARTLRRIPAAAADSASALEAAPPTERFASGPDTDEVPTRTDPGLRKIVEKELELQRRRTRKR